LPIMRPGDVLDGKRLARLNLSTEYYFSRDEATLYKNYVEATSDKSAKGLAKRCRANLTALDAEFIQLVFQLTDDSDRASFSSGTELLQKCTKLCEDLLFNLAEFPQAWKIVNNSSIGSFGSLERAPAVAAYCGLLGLQADFPKISELMLISLLVDVGLMSTDMSFTRKLRSEDPLTKEEHKQLVSIPQKSLDMLLKRKLAIEERTRTTLLAVYQTFEEAADIKIDPQLIRFCKNLDSKTQVKMGKKAPDHLEIMLRMAEGDDNEKQYTVEFLHWFKEKVVPQLQSLKVS
jgi:hypothetical protein